jgi:NAD(P)H-dependent FMN reductase
MASVSIAAREYFGGFSGCSRSRYSRISGRLWKRQPLASATSSTPRSCPVVDQFVEQHAHRVGADLVVEQHARMSRSGSGAGAQMSAVSRTRLASEVFMACA